jgi:hypothetical protein
MYLWKDNRARVRSESKGIGIPIVHDWSFLRERVVVVAYPSLWKGPRRFRRFKYNHKVGGDHPSLDNGSAQGVLYFLHQVYRPTRAA